MTSADAAGAIQSAGYQPNGVATPNCPQQDVVCQQDPPGGTNAPPGSTVLFFFGQ
jgi:hypothetical protein